VAMTIATQLVVALRFLMSLICALVIIEGVKTIVIPRPQPLCAAFLAVTGGIGLLSQLTSDKSLPSFKDTRVSEVRLLIGGVLAMAQCTYLMKTNASGGIYMTWITFGACVANLVIWVFLNLRLDSIGVALATGSKGDKTFWGQLGSQVRSNMISPSRPRVLTGFGVILIFLVWLFAVLLPWDDVAKHDSRWNSIRKTLTADGADAARRATAYWGTQKPLIQQSLKTNFTLHPYFAATEVWYGARWDEIINQRISSMGSQLDNEGKKGFKIEKDKCAMFIFFKNNEIPIPDLLTIAYTKDDAMKTLEDIQANPSNYKFPMFLKGCHLTQGSDKGMRPLKKKDLTEDRFNNILMPWLEKKWKQRPNDSGRNWATTMNRLLDTLEPGIAFQLPFRGMRVSPYNTPLEVKVEVIWGRAYLGLFADYHDVIALRDGSLEFTCRDKACPEWWSHGNSPDLRLKWAVENGHMEAVWALAERVANAIGIDEVRVDIFIDPSRPTKPVVNEISLSSGHEYMYHTDYLAEAWAAPHLAKSGQMQPGSWPSPRIRATNVEVVDQAPANSKR